MPNLTITDGMVPTAAQINANWRDQVVTTCTSATRPSGTEGQIIFETDTDLCYIYNGGWVRFGASGGWTSYTPTLTQSGAVTKTVTYAKYEKIGRLVSVQVYLSVTGTGTANNVILVGLPVTASVGAFAGAGFVYDASAGYNPAIAIAQSTSTVQLLDTTQVTSSAGVYLGQTGTAMAAALASGDIVSFSLVYESAT